jgi:iron complex outermembrane receptor protein
MGVAGGVIMLKNENWLAALVALLLCGAAQAQSTPQGATSASASGPAQTEDIQEIVVTARKRVETVQSVPATVTVVDQAELAAVGITSFTDISKILPAINVAPSPDSNQFAATVRGLGTEPGNPSFDSSVATYIDGAFLSRDREFGASLFDMGSLETISGTQAALLGKNSSLGAINLVTNKPGDVYEIDARYQHEFELHSDRVEIGFDVPLSSTLKFRVAGLYDGEGGPVRDVLSGEQYRDQKAGGRITALWMPSEIIDVTALFQATTMSQRVQPLSLPCMAARQIS